MAFRVRLRLHERTGDSSRRSAGSRLETAVLTAAIQRIPHPPQKPEPVKQPIVEERGFKDIRLFDEWVAEIHSSTRAASAVVTYRLIIVRKDLIVSEPRQGRLFDDYTYLFYITNDAYRRPNKLCFRRNYRCQQENILAQLNAVHRRNAPVDNLDF